MALTLLMFELWRMNSCPLKIFQKPSRNDPYATSATISKSSERDTALAGPIICDDLERADRHVPLLLFTGHDPPPSRAYGAARVRISARNLFINVSSSRTASFAASLLPASIASAPLQYDLQAHTTGAAPALILRPLIAPPPDMLYPAHDIAAPWGVIRGGWTGAISSSNGNTHD
ncbi:hypothetical protein C8F01DRAFT_1263162 [Mycena amicta]|nr:hypothetical protein C8F01DRAFT_1263162 [Mycena amicta]